MVMLPLMYAALIAEWHVSLLLGVMAILTAWLERRDGWRYGALSERVARLEALEEARQQQSPPLPPTLPQGGG